MILVTGANGFVGSALHKHLLHKNVPVLAVSRGAAPGCVPIGSIDESTDWSQMLAGVDAVVHLAARVHVMRDTADNPLQEFRKANVHATMNLARQAAAAGVRRFVLVSSIKVNGEQTEPGRPFRPDDPPQPVDPYGISKLEAERALLDLACDSGIEVTIVRPPLVYGPGVKANFLNMMKVLHWGLPLPLGAINNRRSLVFLENLVDLLMLCVTHPAAKNQIFLAGDGRDLSTTELCRLLAGALGRPARLLPVPSVWIDSAAALLGKRAFSRRLCGSLQVDISKAETLLGWRPPVSVKMALEQTAEHFLASRERKGA